jgi:FkbM family methyltransferase
MIFTSIIKREINRALSRFGFVLRDYRKLPEVNLLGLSALPIQTILDVGANEGQFGTWIRQRFPNAEIISFEPVPHAFARLKEVSLKHENWTAYNLALGEVDGSADLRVHVDHTSSSSFLEATEEELAKSPEIRAQESVTVTVNRLDSWWMQQRTAVTSGLLIKLDVQGFELKVMNGGGKVFAQADAAIVEIIVQALYENQARFDEIVDKMRSFGMVFHGAVEYGFDPSGRVVSFDAIFMR